MTHPLKTSLVGPCRTYRYQLVPTTKQAAALTKMLVLQCELYNVALEQRQIAWRRGKHRVTYVDQTKELKTLDEVRPETLQFGVVLCRGTLKRLDRAFDGFFRRCKAGQTPGYPRFRSRFRFDSLQWEDTNGWKLKIEVSRLRIHGLGEVKVRLHRECLGIPKAITVKREGRRWFLSVRCVDVPAKPLSPTGREIGIDLGATELLGMSDGTLERAPQFSRLATDRLASAQRNLATKKRGSRRRTIARERVAACHRAVRNQRHNHAHQLSRKLVRQYDLIVVENLAISRMVRRPKPRPAPDGSYEPNGATAKAALNKKILDAGWGQLLQMLAYKAEDAGRELLVVDPRFSSQRCAHCGHTDRKNRHRTTFHCTACGHRDHADANAACNILWAGRALRASARVESN